jgi:hypothetical protein
LIAYKLQHQIGGALKNFKLIKITALVAAITFLATGCVKLNMDLTVNKNDTVSGTMVFAFSKEIAELGGDASESGTPTTGLLGDAENVTVTPYDDGEFVGSTYTFENLPLENFNPDISDSSSFGIQRVENEIIVSGVLDSSDEGSSMEDNPFGAAFVAGLMESTDIRISITLPGKITETNGELVDQTITWYGKFGERIDMSATSYSPQGIDIPWLPIAGIVLAALITGLVVLALTRRRGRESDELVLDFDN